MKNDMVHPLEGLVSEINNQIKNLGYVHIIIDKETIGRMRKSLLNSHEKAVAVGGVGGIDPRLKNFRSRKYTIREDANWISKYIRRNLGVDHKLKFIVGGTDIHIVSANE